MWLKKNQLEKERLNLLQGRWNDSGGPVQLTGWEFWEPGRRFPIAFYMGFYMTVGECHHAVLFYLLDFCCCVFHLSLKKKEHGRYLNLWSPKLWKTEFYMQISYKHYLIWPSGLHELQLIITFLKLEVGLEN